MKRFSFIALGSLLLLVIVWACGMKASSLPANSLQVGKCIVRGKMPAMFVVQAQLEVCYNQFFENNSEVYPLTVDAQGNITGEIPLNTRFAHALVMFSAGDETNLQEMVILDQNDTLHITINEQKQLIAEGAYSSHFFRSRDWVDFLSHDMDRCGETPKVAYDVLLKSVREGRLDDYVSEEMPIVDSLYPKATSIEDRDVLRQKQLVYRYVSLLNELSRDKVSVPANNYRFLSEINFDHGLLYTTFGLPEFVYQILSEPSLKIPRIGAMPIKEWKEKLRQQLALVPYKPNEFFCDLMVYGAYYWQLSEGKPLTAQQEKEVQTGFSEAGWGQVLMQQNAQLKKEQARQSHLVNCAEKGQPKTLEQVLAQHEGKAVVVDLWYSACGPCAKMSETIYRVLDEKPFAAIELADITSVEMTPLKDWQQMKESKGGWHYLLPQPEIERIMKTHDAAGFPTLLFFDKRHRLLKVHTGMMGEDEFRSLCREMTK